MRIEQKKWTQSKGWQPSEPSSLRHAAQVVFLFGSTSQLRQPQCIVDLKAAYPKAHLMGCSTAGEICDTRVLDDSLVATAVCFEHTKTSGALVAMDKGLSSLEAGRQLERSLDKKEEVEGVRDVVGNHTVMTGFYSYGEISPFTPNARCELHNQTMTITTFSEQ